MSNAAAEKVERASSDLVSTNVNINPVGAVFNITSNLVEDFMFDYLRKQRGLTSVIKVICSSRPSRGVTRIHVHVALDLNNDEVISNMKDVAEDIRRRMRGSNFTPGEKVQKVLGPLIQDGIIEMETRARDNFGIVEIDTFRVLGLMLDVDHNKHRISIPDVHGTDGKNKFIFTAIKREKFVDRNSGASFTDIYRERANELLNNTN